MFNFIKLTKAMERTVRVDVSQKIEFKRAGYDYKMLVFDDEHHCGIWKMTRVIDGEVLDMGYEVVKGIKRVNPDGTVVYRYPCSEEFGTSGFFSYNLDRCMEIMSAWLKD